MIKIKGFSMGMDLNKILNIWENEVSDLLELQAGLGKN